MTKKLDSKKTIKKMIISFVLVICASSVLADKSVDSPKALAPKTLAPAQELDEKNICYYEGKAFSEGAKLNGMTCQHKPTVDVFGKNKIVFHWQEDEKATSQPLAH